MKYLLLSVLLTLAGGCLAAIDAYTFAEDGQHKRYRNMLDELRCPKCQNQNLTGSDAPIAQDLRRELHRLITEGEDDAAIKDFMVQRYGNFVLYRPPLDKNTLLLWSLPLLLLIIGLLLAGRIRQGQGVQGSAGQLTAAEQQQLDSLLQHYRQRD